MNRNEFLYKLSLLCFSCSGFIKQQTNLDFTGSFIPCGESLSVHLTKEPAIGFDQFIDLHCHPALKVYLWEKKIWKRHPSSKGSNAFNLQVDINKLVSGNVRGFLAAHYLPERGLIVQSRKVKILYPLIQLFIPGLGDKIEEGKADNFRQIMVMLDAFEEQVAIANATLSIKRNGKDVIKIAHSYKEFEDHLNSGIIAVAQTIEGAHSLGRDVDAGSPDLYLLCLEILFKRGVCLMTLAHFFPNDLCVPVEGMTPYTKSAAGYKFKYEPDTGNKPLSANGKSVVRKMLELGMLVDITHLSPAARAEVFDINKDFRRPIVFSHTGVQHLFNGPKAYDNFRYYCASDDDIKNIRDCNGVIGIICMTYFLTGTDEHMAHGDKTKPANVIDHIIETIKYIRTKTTSYENISLGSDFDNFGNAPPDLRDPSFFPSLLNSLRNIPGINEEEIGMLTHGNALRVLREGWKR